MKRTFYTEIAYLIGVFCTAFGVALMTVADLGVSMVVAPAYLIYRKVSLILPCFTFGMSEYLFQGLLLIIMIIVLRKFKLSYLFSFVTAVVYGFVLDGCMFLVSFIPADQFWVRIVLFFVGWLVVAFGISMMFQTYISPEVYELFVKEVSAEKGIAINKMKTAYDLSSLVLGIILSFAFFGFGAFVGVSIGTVICALLNGFTIGCFSKLLEKHFEFKDKLKIKNKF
jgi:uncharacterized membrane protein YczE